MILPQSIVKWQICEPVTNNAGGKTAAILDENNSPNGFTTSILKAPFDASSYNDPEASRVGLCLEADAQLSEWLQELDGEFWKLWGCMKVNVLEIWKWGFWIYGCQKHSGREI